MFKLEDFLISDFGKYLIKNGVEIKHIWTIENNTTRINAIYNSKLFYIDTNQNLSEIDFKEKLLYYYEETHISDLICLIDAYIRKIKIMEIIGNN